MIDIGKFTEDPILHQVAAVSCGIIEGVPMVDLNYYEDSNADLDSNFVMNEQEEFVEVQCTAEQVPLKRTELDELCNLATAGINKLLKVQKESLNF